MKRIEREYLTMKAMVRLYCKAHHVDSGRLCKECREFLDYSQKRLSKCPYQNKKPTCGNCPIHCYSNKMQKKAKVIMRFSGPKMIWHHPIMALTHFFDGFRKLHEYKNMTNNKKNIDKSS